MVLRLATHAMGTRFELVLGGENSPQRRAAGEQALFELEQIDRRLSLFRRDSLLAHVNRTAGAKPVVLDPDTFALFAAADEVVRATDGAFDPTVAPVLRALGLHGDEATTARHPIEDARASVGWRGGVELDPATRSVRFTRPGLALDLGGIAKGHGLDLAAESLRENGIDVALLHGGTSSVVALGAPPERDGWRVTIGPGADAPCALLRDQSLSVSSPSGRASAAGEHHLIDPRTGAPTPADVRVAAVIATSARTADAWSTALLIDPTRAREQAPRGLETLIRSGDPAAWRHALPSESASFHLSDRAPQTA